MKEILVKMVKRSLMKLREHQKLTACVTVKIRIPFRYPLPFQQQVPYTPSTNVLIPIVKETVRQAVPAPYADPPDRGTFQQAGSGSQQIDLFEDSLEMINLYQAMDRIR